MAETKVASNAINLHTEAHAVQDWSSLADYILNRCNHMQSESQQLVNVFETLKETYGKYCEMTRHIKESISTQKDYENVPDYHET